MRQSDKNTDTCTSSSVYEDMTRGRRNTSFSSRMSKTMSLDFPPPPMNLFNNPLFHPSSPRCVKCVNLFSHFSIRCRGCSKPVCCVCAHQEKKCDACKLSYHHPDNIIERSDDGYVSFDNDFMHECVVSTLKNRVTYFSPHGDSLQNNCFLMKTQFSLDLITTECLEDSPAFTKTLLLHVLEAFHREPVNINLTEIFNKWKPTNKFLRNLMSIDFSDESQIPPHGDYSCISPSGRFLFIIKSMEDTARRQLKDKSFQPQNSCQGSCRLIKTCICFLIVTSMFLVCFVLDFNSYK